MFTSWERAPSYHPRQDGKYHQIWVGNDLTSSTQPWFSPKWLLLGPHLTLGEFSSHEQKTKNNQISDRNSQLAGALISNPLLCAAAPWLSITETDGIGYSGGGSNKHGAIVIFMLADSVPTEGHWRP